MSENCKHLIERKDKCSFCGERGTAYCMLPAADPYYVDAQDCARFNRCVRES